jgi:hypothetical protein
MSAYVKCLKEIMSKDKGLKDVKIVTLNNLFSKLKNLGSFIIPYFLENTKFYNTLCDLGVSISLMSRSFFERLDIIDLK